MLTWDGTEASHLGVVSGIPATQSLWELATLVLAIIKWADIMSGLCFLGDNIASLELALSGKAKGAMGALARELFWRKARGQWHYGVGHLAAEANVTADSLSRFAQPGVVPSLPERCSGAAEVFPESLCELWKV